MAYTKEQKEKQTEIIREQIASADSLFLVSLSGLSVNEVNQLRATLRAKGAKMRVVKNRLAKRVVADGNAEKITELLSGPTAIVSHDEDPVETAKQLVNFAKDHPELELKGGLVGMSDLVDGEGVKAVSELPTIDEARSMLLALFNEPATRLARILNTPAGQLATVLDKKSEAGAAAE